MGGKLSNLVHVPMKRRNEVNHSNRDSRQSQRLKEYLISSVRFHFRWRLAGSVSHVSIVRLAKVHQHLDVRVRDAISFRPDWLLHHGDQRVSAFRRCSLFSVHVIVNFPCSLADLVR